MALLARGLLLSTLLLPFASQDPQPPTVAALEERLLALGPFRAEYRCGIKPEATVLFALHLDLKNRRARVDYQPEGRESPVAEKGRIQTADFALGFVDWDFMRIRRDMRPLYEILDRSQFELAQPRPPERGPSFPRILRPYVALNINDRIEPRGAMSFFLGNSLTGGCSWLHDAERAGPLAWDGESKGWIYAGPRGRRTCLDADSGLIRWIEIPVDGKSTRVLELKSVRSPVPVPDLEPGGLEIDMAPSASEVTRALGRSNVESFWKALDRSRGTPEEERIKTVWIRFAADIAALLEADDVRNAARAFIQKECPDDGSWAPGSKGLEEARGRFLASPAAQAEARAARRLARLEEWRSGIKETLEAEAEDGTPVPAAAEKFLKESFKPVNEELPRRALPEAAAIFAAEEKLWPPIVHFLRGTEAYKKRDYRRSEAQMTALLKLWPDLAEGHMNLGNARVMLGNPKGAVEAYSRALELKPRVERGYRLRAEAYARDQEWAKAKNDYTRAIERDPEDRDAWIGRGRSHNRLKDYAAAVRDFAKALEMRSADAATLVERGRSLWYLEDRDGARADFTAAIDADPESPDAYFMRGSLDRDKNRTVALEDMKKALEVAPKDWFYRKRAEELLEEMKK